MFRNLLFIGIGGFIGGICRYLLQQYVQNNYPSSIPLGTLIVNIIGCFVIGLVYALSDKGNLLSPEMRLFLATGICGGFTTFSSFAYENVSMALDGEFLYALLYVSLSVIIGFGAVHAGILFIKLIF
ncbi:fluoride efflux transporter CrcB [Parafilimonas sp.]|jgi:CrcB protein|uniref:fluoride efflux transporter CrcB n=1 Tax=Parafilimonas sp. TaxID=1969739 RepID=UPI003F7DD719